MRVCPVGMLGRMQSWVSRHRALTAALVAFFGTGAVVLYYQHASRRRNRRAKRAVDGSRKEVVVVAGPAGGAVTKSVAMDLERRGFIVYVVCHGAEEEQEVHDLARADIRPLNLELVEVSTFVLAACRWK